MRPQSDFADHLNAAREPCVQWASDCQGKQSYDGPLLSISTRYWPGPSGGGSMEVDTSKPPNEMMISTVPYGETPSAKAEIVLHHGQFGDGYGEEIALREAEFTGPDEASVKRKVEEWVQAQFDDVVKMLRYWR